MPASPTLIGTAAQPPTEPLTDAAPVGWPERLADHPFGWPTTPDRTAEPARPGREETPVDPSGVVEGRDEPPTQIERDEEAHLDWLRHLPERREEVPAGHPAAHGRADPPAPHETRRREWTERLVVGLVAGLVTFAATRWAGAGWSTAAWIGATVLVVVPAAAWVATLGARSSAPGRPDSQPDQQPEH